MLWSHGVEVFGRDARLYWVMSRGVQERRKICVETRVHVGKRMHRRRRVRVEVCVWGGGGTAGEGWVWVCVDR